MINYNFEKSWVWINYNCEKSLGGGCEVLGARYEVTYTALRFYLPPRT